MGKFVKPLWVITHSIINIYHMPLKKGQKRSESVEEQQTDPAALKAAYKQYIKKFTDEIEDITKLCKLYTYAQAFWIADSK